MNVASLARRSASLSPLLFDEYLDSDDGFQAGSSPLLLLLLLGGRSSSSS